MLYGCYVHQSIHAHVMTFQFTGSTTHHAHGIIQLLHIFGFHHDVEIRQIHGPESQFHSHHSERFQLAGFY